MNFESNITQLETIIDELEKGSQTLDEIVAKYKQGMDLACACTNMLKDAEQEIRIFEDGKMQAYQGREAIGN